MCDDRAVDSDDVLERAWRAHVGRDSELGDRLLERLRTRHRERQRAYHTLEHVAAVLTHVEQLAELEPVNDLGAVVAAACYHDAIYEPQHVANERASARLARRDLQRLGWAGDRTELVAAMIEATRTHVDPRDVDTAVLFDADLAILGAAPDVYGRYVDQVRAEYSHLDDQEWAAGRRAVLRQFLDRSQIYATATGRDRWERSARANLTAELTRWQE